MIQHPFQAIQNNCTRYNMATTRKMTMFFLIGHLPGNNPEDTSCAPNKLTVTCLLNVLCIPLTTFLFRVSTYPILRSSACIVGFSSTAITMALSGGFKYSQIISAAFAENSGSVLIHQERCLARQIFCLFKNRKTASGDTFSLFANDSPSHVAKPSGGVSSSSCNTDISNS